jgi:hypothetical protein
MCLKGTGREEEVQWGGWFYSELKFSVAWSVQLGVGKGCAEVYICMYVLIYIDAP